MSVEIIPLAGQYRLGKATIPDPDPDPDPDPGELEPTAKLRSFWGVARFRRTGEATFVEYGLGSEPDPSRSFTLTYTDALDREEEVLVDYTGVREGESFVLHEVWNGRGQVELLKAGYLPYVAEHYAPIMAVQPELWEQCSFIPLVEAGRVEEGKLLVIVQGEYFALAEEVDPGPPPVYAWLKT
jgi:hypothetical protein